MGTPNLRVYCPILDRVGLIHGQGPPTEEDGDTVLRLSFIPQAVVHFFLVNLSSNVNTLYNADVRL
jgi:hypothetical protein